MEDIIVTVIGGSGFLGQHIVRELQRWQIQQDTKSNEFELHTVNSFDAEGRRLRNENVSGSPIKSVARIKEIVVLDIKPFKPTVDIVADPPVHFRECDIRLAFQVDKEVKASSVVIHCAEVKPSLTGNAPDDASLVRTNVEGTANVIRACKKANVKALIYSSTVGVVMAGNKILCHTESHTPKADEDQLLLGSYAKSKRSAEIAVIEAHQTATAGGQKLSTIVLRPTAMYGEGDAKFIPSFIKMAKAAGGTLPAVGSPYAYHHLTYAGNAAAAHVTALLHLLEEEHFPLENCGGLPVYICDNTPPGQSDMILEPFLAPCGLATTKPTQYLFLTIWFSLLLTFWIEICRKIGRQHEWVNSRPSTLLHKLAGTSTVVGNLRAETALKFRPKYSWEESKSAAVAYYRSNRF